MSDANTAIARDGKRSDAIAAYFDVFLRYLKGGASTQELRSAAEESDAVRGGWGNATNFSSETHTVLEEQMLQDDRDAWLQFMLKLMDPERFHQFKDISPFRDKALLKVKYSAGEPTIVGPGVAALLAQALGKLGLEFDPHDDKFLLTLPLDTCLKAELLSPNMEK